MMSNESIPTSLPNHDPEVLPEEPKQTLAAGFAGRTGIINSGLGYLSQNTGKEFTRLLVLKHDAARNAVSYLPALPRDYEPVRIFLCENGWAHRFSDPEQFAQMLRRTDRAVVAWDEGNVVGFARALCDGVSNGYIGTVAVAADRRGQGIGRELVKRLIGDNSDITWVLRAGRGSEGFWQKMGFAVSDTAMERTRK